MYFAQIPSGDHTPSRSSIFVFLIFLLTVLRVNITSLPKVIWDEGRVAALSHTYAVEYPLVGAPQIRPKVPLRVDRSSNPTTCLIPGPVRPMMPNGIRIRSAVFPRCAGQTDAETDRSSTGKFDHYIIGRCAKTATRPNNNYNNNIDTQSKAD